ncbi:MAG: hypothetical protein KJZ93_17020 [Caldilineaceae bacterium]|nr:hypothetical protein [Caldilineaceae bacterium]
MHFTLRDFFNRQQPFLALFLLFASFRLLAILLFRPGGFIADASDYDFYALWGQLEAMGYRTFENLWTAYPPLFPALMLPVFELASRAPPWVEPRLAFHTLFGLTLLLFECGNLILIHRLAQRLAPAPLSPVTNLQPAILYALLFTPVYTLLGWFEAMPLFFLLLGLELLLSATRWGWIGSAVAAGLGFLTKLTPAILVPVAVRWLGARLSWAAARDEWFRLRSPGGLLRPACYVLIFAGTIAGLGYLLVGGNLSLALSSFRVNAIRPPWQSLWAILDGFYGFGLAPVDMRNLIGLERAHWESRLPWPVITAGFGLLYLWLYTRRYDWAQPRTPIAFTAASVIWLFLYSKGWSPQFLVWVLAFLVLLLPTLRGMVIATVLSVANVVESSVYLVLLPDERWLLVGTVLVRTALLLLLMVEFLSQIWPAPRIAARMARTAAALTWGVMALAVVGAGVATPQAAHAYQARRLAEHPCRGIIEALQAEAGDPERLVVSDQLAIWQDFYPWLRNQYTIRIIDGYDPLDRPWRAMVAQRLDEAVGDAEFWWIERPDPPSQAGDYFALPGVQILEAQTFGPCTLQRVIRLADAPQAIATDEPIHLRRAALGKAQVGAQFHLVLYWQAIAPVGGRYTVFTQVLNEAGQLVAQQDNAPAAGQAPTDAWQPGAVVRDPFVLGLPADLPAGDYRLIVGLYDEAGRLRWQLPNGETSDHVGFELRITSDE